MIVKMTARVQRINFPRLVPHPKKTCFFSWGRCFLGSLICGFWQEAGGREDHHSVGDGRIILLTNGFADERHLDHTGLEFDWGLFSPSQRQCSLWKAYHCTGVHTHHLLTRLKNLCYKTKRMWESHDFSLFVTQCAAHAEVLTFFSEIIWKICKVPLLGSFQRATPYSFVYYT